MHEVAGIKLALNVEMNPVFPPPVRRLFHHQFILAGFILTLERLVFLQIYLFVPLIEHWNLLVQPAAFLSENRC